MPSPPGRLALGPAHRPGLGDVEQPEEQEAGSVGERIEAAPPRASAIAPATSSMTIEPGSVTPLARPTCSAAHQPMTKTIAAAISERGSRRSASRSAQAKGRAASEPQVPGATGSKPAPNQVASSDRRMAARAGGRSRMRHRAAQSGRRTVATACAGDAFAAAGEAELLGRRRLDADPRACRCARISAMRAHHRVAMRADLRPLADHRHIDMGDAAAGARRRDRRHGAGSDATARRAIADRPAGNACRYRRRRARRGSRRSARAARHRRRNGRPAPGSCGIATPHSQTWSPGPKACTSKPWPVRMSPCRAASSRSAAARSSVVVTLKFSSLPATSAHREPGALGDRGIVGQIAPGGGAMRGEDRADSGSPAASAPATARRGRASRRRRRRAPRFTVSRSGSAGIAPGAPSSAVEHAVDQSRHRERAARRHGSARARARASPGSRGRAAPNPAAPRRRRPAAGGRGRGSPRRKARDRRD